MLFSIHEADIPVSCKTVHCNQARREGGQKASLSGVRGHRGTRGSELLGLECKIHQLKLRPADAMMFFLFRAEIRTSADAMTFFLLIT